MPREKPRRRPLLSAAATRSLTALAAAEQRSPSALVRKLIDERTGRHRAEAAHDRLNDMLDGLFREVTAARSETLVALHALYPFMRLLMTYTAVLPPPGAEAKALGEARFATFIDTVDRLIAMRVHNQPGRTDTPEA